MLREFGENGGRGEVNIDEAENLAVKWLLDENRVLMSLTSMKVNFEGVLATNNQQSACNK